MFSIVILCALSFESIRLYVRLIFFMFFGEKFLISLKKNPILGDLTALYFHWLTFVVSLGFLLMILILKWVTLEQF